MLDFWNFGQPKPHGPDRGGHASRRITTTPGPGGWRQKCQAPARLLPVSLSPGWGFGFGKRGAYRALIPAAALLLLLGIGCATAAPPSQGESGAGQMASGSVESQPPGSSGGETNVTTGAAPVSTPATESEPAAAATAAADAGGEKAPTDATAAADTTQATDTPVAQPSPVAEITPTEAPMPQGQIAQGPLAAEVGGIANWINSEPLTVAELRGKVVLVDFWTYTCVNCIRTFPYLREWHARYADDGLVILGIHTPEFEFEKDYDNVTQATKEHSIVWPVAQDNDFVTWRNYNNRYWPAKYLIDRNGVVRYTHFGEGKYAETEEKILELLFETGADVDTQGMEFPEDQKIDSAFNRLVDDVTPELYAGYQRNYNSALYGRGAYVRQQEYFDSLDAVTNFVTSDDPDPSKIYFHGPWLIESERAKHARNTDNYEDFIDLKYSAKSVNVVLTSDSGEPYKVRLTVEGEYLTEANKGEDVIIGPDGESYILVTEPRLYALINNPSYVRRELLRMSSNSDDFGIFAFTFGVYEEGL